MDEYIIYQLRDSPLQQVSEGGLFPSQHINEQQTSDRIPISPRNMDHFLQETM